MTTFIYIPGGLEQVWACRHVFHDSVSSKLSGDVH